MKPKVATLMRSMIAVALLLLAPAVVFGISDAGRPELTRIYSGDNFACTATYIFPYVNDYVSWVVTAGHCTIADGAKRNSESMTTGIINWRGKLQYGTSDVRYTDVAIGTVPDMRDGAKKRMWLGEDPKPRQQVYIHGFPAGVERVSVGYVVPNEYLERVTVRVPQPFGWSEDKLSNYLKADAMIVKKGEIEGGSSGSPLLDEHDRIVGILWGMVPHEAVVSGVPEGYELVLYTPISRVRALMEILGVK